MIVRLTKKTKKNGMSFARVVEARPIAIEDLNTDLQRSLPRYRSVRMVSVEAFTLDGTAAFCIKLFLPYLSLSAQVGTLHNHLLYLTKH